MDLIENGKLLYTLRTAKGMTQKQVADRLGIQPKTVSKWETGHGFPDVSTLSDLADIFGVSERTLLSGRLARNMQETGNMKHTKFYVCPLCGSFTQGIGEGQPICCGKPLKPLTVQPTDEAHALTVSEIEEDTYIEFHHDMTKEHFISFVAYVACDRVLIVKLYPEQDAAVRFPKMFGGRLYYYCNRHGLFVHSPKKRPAPTSEEKGNLTALLSAFARAYHAENSPLPVFADHFAKRLFSADEYAQIEKFVELGGHDVKRYVNEQLAPTPLSRARFCEDSLKTAVLTGTRQYVILASGFDTFALRNPSPDLSVYEIDKPEVLADKKRRMERAGLRSPNSTRYISADLSTTDLEKVLIENGFDKRKKTFFSCLGLFYYLTKAEIGRLVEGISKFAAEGSTLLFDFPDNHFFSSDVPRVQELVKMASESGAPMKSCFGYEELEKLLGTYDFYLYEFLSDKEMQARYFADRDDGLTPFEHVNYALAVLKP